MSQVHPQARTTPRTRAEIANSSESIHALAKRFNINRVTARKWKNRSDVQDRSHRAHTLHTTLSPAQEVLVLMLRKTCLLPLDDLVVITRRFIHADASRSGVSRLLRREGLSKLSDLLPQTEPAPQKTFKDYEPGFVHVDIKYLPKMPDETSGRYLFVAIDRATRWVFMHVYDAQTQVNSTDFLRRVVKAAPFTIVKLLTDNGAQFTDRFTGASGTASGQHLFDKQCQSLGIEHRLIVPRHPQTNGMVERFNGRISELVKQTKFASADELHRTLMSYLKTYNHHIPQKSLNYLCPVEALQDWQIKKPELFHKRVYKRAEMDKPISPDVRIPQQGPLRVAVSGGNAARHQT